MKPQLEPYRGMRICVAVSGGKDSMALLHYLYVHAAEYGIALSALNCDHGIRGEVSARDSAFVKQWCLSHRIPFLFFEWKNPSSLPKTEERARVWRRFCFALANQPSEKWKGTDGRPEIYTEDGVWRGADAVATAHHLNDNAETVLFHLARGCGLEGASGIYDNPDSYERSVVHPLIGCTREEIDEYVAENALPYVEDESNFTDDYTRNRIRRHVLPELEKAVPGAAKALFRFSRLAAEDEAYFRRQAKKLRVKCPPYGEGVLFCEERVVFKRAILEILGSYQRKDYTSDQMERLYWLQFAENGKKFEFLGLTAFKEEGKIVLIDDTFLKWQNEGVPFRLAAAQAVDRVCGQLFLVTTEGELEEDAERVRAWRKSEGGGTGAIRRLRFDLDAVPDDATVRLMRTGDRFTKFGGGAKKLGDYFTDRKIPVRVRRWIPVIASGSDVLAVGGVEISDRIKVTERTKRVGYLICDDYTK